MEPLIKLGHSFLCKKSVVGSDHKIYYTEGKTYQCEMKSTYNPKAEHSKYACGHITNNFGDKGHAWPYEPENHPFCGDCWTDFFTELNK